ncbi:MAG: hypothetical protein RLO51_01805 [Thalassobaculum sp.]|uniref:hypothetical protein n=1 Tax=Thalassobaculum sp. TaxID=2022740 RepID=UPI0032F0132D
MEALDYLSFMLLALLYAFGVLVMVPYTYVNRHKPYSSYLISVGWFAVWNTLFTVLLVAAEGSAYELRRIATIAGVATAVMSVAAALHCLAAVGLATVDRRQLPRGIMGFFTLERAGYQRMFPFLYREGRAAQPDAPLSAAKSRTARP